MFIDIRNKYKKDWFTPFDNQLNRPQLKDCDKTNQKFCCWVFCPAFVNMQSNQHPIFSHAIKLPSQNHRQFMGGFLWPLNFSSQKSISHLIIVNISPSVFPLMLFYVNTVSIWSLPLWSPGPLMVIFPSGTLSPFMTWSDSD